MGDLEMAPSINNPQENNEEKNLRIEDIRKGDEFTYKVIEGGEEKMYIVRAQGEEKQDWSRSTLEVKQVGGFLNGRILENVQVSTLTRKKDEE